jgi:hypothetical protein
LIIPTKVKFTISSVLGPGTMSRWMSQLSMRLFVGSAWLMSWILWIITCAETVRYRVVLAWFALRHPEDI